MGISFLTISSSFYNLPDEKITKGSKNINQNKSQKCLEIEKQLKVIKRKLKKRYISKLESERLLEKLTILKKDIEKNISALKRVDNIPSRLNQIEQYCQKLQNMNGSIESSKSLNVENINSEPTKKKIRVVLRKNTLTSK